MMSLSEAARIARGTRLGDDAEFTSVSTDSRTVGAGGLFVAIPGKNLDGHDFLSHADAMGAVGAMVSDRTSAGGLSAGSKLALIVVPDTTLALGQLGRDWRSRFDIPLAAITGSNGKTTVTAMTASIFGRRGLCLAPERSFNNAWGVPLTLLKLDSRHRFAVIEMGTSHPGEIGYLARLARPDIALINNVAPAHLAGLGNIRQVAVEKAGIFSGLADSGVAVLNADDEFHDQWVAGLRALRPGVTIMRFALGGRADVSARNVKPGTRASHFELLVEGRSIAVELPLPGLHNVMNALAAATVCLAAGAGPGEIRDGLEAVSAVAGRLDIKSGLSGSTVIDDSYNANPGSMRAAIQVLQQYQGTRILALGAMAELGETSVQLHEEIGAYAKNRGIERLYCYAPEGNDHARFYAHGFGDEARVFDSMQELQGAARQILAPDVVMLIKGSRSSGMENLALQVVGEDLSSRSGKGFGVC